MEQAEKTAQRLVENPTRTDSEHLETNSTPSMALPSRDEAEEMFKIITKIRLSHGWTAQTFDDAEPTILVWYTQFKKYGIPFEAYTELFDRAFQVREQAIRQNGIKDAPMMDLALLVSRWTGPHGLRAEWERKRVESGRSIPDTVARGCKRCWGTGQEHFYDENGNKQGVGKGASCGHRQVTEGEGIWLYLKRKEL